MNDKFRTIPNLLRELADELVTKYGGDCHGYEGYAGPIPYIYDTIDRLNEAHQRTDGPDRVHRILTGQPHDRNDLEIVARYNEFTEYDTLSDDELRAKIVEHFASDNAESGPADDDATEVASGVSGSYRILEPFPREHSDIIQRIMIGQVGQTRSELEAVATAVNLPFDDTDCNHDLRAKIRAHFNQE